METKFNPIQAVKEVNSQFQKPGTKSVLLQQSVEKIYPSVGNNTGGIISDSELPAGKPFISKRNFIAVIPETMSIEALNERLQKFPNARLRRTLSHEPILSEGQKWAIREGKTTIEVIKNNQIVQKADPITGEVTVFEKDGKTFFRTIELSAEGKPDVDLTENTRF